MQVITLPQPVQTGFVRVVILDSTDHGGRDFTAISEIQVQGQANGEGGTVALLPTAVVAQPTVAATPTVERATPVYVWFLRSFGEGRFVYGSTVRSGNNNKLVLPH